jgi:hypothetical protein
MGMATVTQATVQSLKVTSLEEEFKQEVAGRGLELNEETAKKSTLHKVKAELAQQGRRIVQEATGLAFVVGLLNFGKLELVMNIINKAAKEGLGRQPIQVKAKQKNPWNANENAGFTTAAAGAAALTAGSAAAVAQAAKRKNPPAAFVDQASADTQGGDQSPSSLDAEAAWWAKQIDGNTMVANRLLLETDDVVWLTLRKLQANPGVLERVRGYFVDKATADGGRLDEGTSRLLDKIDNMAGTVDQPTVTEVAENKWDQLAPMFEALKTTDDPEKLQAIVCEIGERVDLKAPTNLDIVATVQGILEAKRQHERELDEEERRSHA